MRELTIFNSEKQELGKVAFLKDISSQVKIKEIKSISDFNSQTGSIMLSIINHLAIKEAVSQIEKDDVKEMILMRFNHFSLNEIAYAFKLERYGLFGDKTQHFQLFNADYVSTVLDKYTNWKTTTIKQHNLNTPKLPEKTDITDYEKIELFKNTLKNEFENYKKVGKVNDMRNWLYEDLSKKISLSKNITDIIWRESVKEIKEKQRKSLTFEKYSPGDIKTKAIVLCKSKIIARVFDKFTAVEQLLGKIK